jgi:hypothetical protein
MKNIDYSTMCPLAYQSDNDINKQISLDVRQEIENKLSLNVILSVYYIVTKPIQRILYI